MDNISLAKVQLNEAVYLLSATTVLAIFYTFVFILYCLSFRLSYARLWDYDSKIKRQTACTLVLQTVLLICATLDIISSNHHAQAAFVENRELPGGPLGLQSALKIATFARLQNTVNIIENLLVLGVLLWRVRVIWSGTRFVIPLTAVSSFIYLGNAGFSVTYCAIRWNIDSTSLLATPRVQSVIFTMATAFSFASLVFMTLAIIARLLFIRQKHIKLMGKSDVAGQYLGIATMLVESYALDAIWVMGLLISFGLKYPPTANLFSNCGIQIDILTNFLVLFRALSGQAWDRQTHGRLSALRWASNRANTSISGAIDLPQTSVPEGGPPVIGSRSGV